MAETFDLQVVMNKIQKLLRLSKSSNPHEASLAAEKAQELMFAYGLSMAQVEAAHEDGRRFTAEEIRLGTMGSISWKRSLFAHTARACWCEAFWRPATPIGIAVGRRHNVMLLEHLYGYLHREIERMAEADWKRIRSPRLSGTTFKLNFCHGAVDMVAYRLMLKRRSLEDSDSTGKALVVAEDAGLSKYTEYLFPKTKEERMPARNKRPGYGNGVLAGQKIRLDDALESGSQREQIALPGLK